MMKIKDKLVRLSAILLTAVLMALLFMTFHTKNAVNQKPNVATLAPTTVVIRTPQSPIEENCELSPVEQMERQDSLFLATTKNIMTEKEIHQPTPKGYGANFTKKKSKTARAYRKKNTTKDTETSLNAQEESNTPSLQIAINQQDSLQNNRASNLSQAATLPLQQHTADQTEILQTDSLQSIKYVASSGEANHAKSL